MIEPGAGTFSNRRAYDDLAKRFQAHFVGGETGHAPRPAGQGSLPLSRAGGLSYPYGWENIVGVDVSAAPPGEDSLLGLAKRLGESIASGARRPPHIVVAGSCAGRIWSQTLFWGDILRTHTHSLAQTETLCACTLFFNMQRI